VEDQFKIFGLPHIVFLFLLPAIAAGLAWWSGSCKYRIKVVRLTLGITFLLNELVWYWYYVQQDWFLFPYTLPLQLCDILVWIAVVSALTTYRWPRLLLYFWGLTVTTMALLTPDVSTPTFSYLTVRFLVSHGGIIVVLLFLIWTKSFRPGPGSWWRALIALHVYAAAMGLYNYTFGTNFFYLCEKPVEASLLDYLGPWPWYILSGEAIAILFFWLLGLPFRANDRTSRFVPPKADQT
jgi:hypothetical integral membrane protein (TIGR02206 family)